MVEGMALVAVCFCGLYAAVALLLLAGMALDPEWTGGPAETLLFAGLWLPVLLLWACEEGDADE